MYYVAKVYPPYWKDRLHSSGDLTAVKNWAQREARDRGIQLDVREGDEPGMAYGRKHASYDAQGKEL